MRAVTGFGRGILVALIAVTAMAPVALAADGSIRVTLRESEGDQIPILGANVVLEKNDGSIGQIALTTDENGQVFFPAVEEGSGYKVTAVMPGLYAAQVRDDVVVVAGQAANVTFAMIPEIVEEIEVKGEKDLIDVAETTQTTEISDEFFDDLPVLGREYQQVLKLAPGFTDFDGDGNPNVHGARDTDFRMEVDGVSNQDPLTGTFSSFINPDAIEEIQIVDVGVDGRSGGAIGGFGRIRLKEGGNDFNGTFNFLFRDSAFTNDGAGNRDPLDFGRIQPAIFLSGPIVKDHLTFVLSHEYVLDEQPFGIVGGRGDAVQEFESTRNLDRLTWRASAANKISLTYQSDPATLEPSEASAIVPPDTSSNIEARPEVFSLQWSATPSPTFQLETTVAYRNNDTTESPFRRGNLNDCIRSDASINPTNPFLPDADTDTQQCTQVVLGNLRSGTYNIDQEITNSTWTYRADATQFINEFVGGTHSLAFGMSVEQNEYDRTIDLRNSWTLFGTQSTGGSTGLPGEMAGDPAIPGTIGGGLGGLEPGALEATITQTLFAPKIDPDNLDSPSIVNNLANSDVYAVYFDDTYQPMSNLSITLSLRLSHEEIDAGGFVPVDPSAERQAWGEFVDARVAATGDPSIAGFLRTTQGRGPGFFTADPIDLPDLSSPSCFSSANVPSEINTGVCEDLLSAIALISQGRNRDIRLRTQEQVDVDNTNIDTGFAVNWDPNNDQKTVIGGLWTRNYGNTLLLPFVLEQGPFGSTRTGVVDPATLFPTERLSGAGSGFTIRTTDRDLERAFTTIWQLSVQREIAPETVLTLRYVNRKNEQELQDIDVNHGPVPFSLIEQFIEDGISIPGILNTQQLERCQNINGFADCTGTGTLTNQRPDGRADIQVISPYFNNVFETTNANTLDYYAYILELQRRFYQNWEFFGSYRYSKAVGDADDLFSVLGDDTTQFQDQRGFQDIDQRHLLRMTGRVLVPRWGGFRLGFTATYQTGLPYSIVEQRPVFDFPTFFNQGASGEIYLDNTGRGFDAVQQTTQRLFFPTGGRNDQRNSPFWDFEVNFQKEFNIRDLKASFEFSVFNLLNDDTEIIFSVQRQTFADPENPGDLTFVDNPVATRRFGRQFQVGFKLNF